MLLELAKYHYESVLSQKSHEMEAAFEDDYLINIAINILFNQTNENLTDLLPTYFENYDDFALSFIKACQKFIQKKLIENRFNEIQQKSFLRILSSIPQNIESIQYSKKFLSINHDMKYLYKLLIFDIIS